MNNPLYEYPVTLFVDELGLLATKEGMMFVSDKQQARSVSYIRKDLYDSLKVDFERTLVIPEDPNW